MASVSFQLTPSQTSPAQLPAQQSVPTAPQPNATQTDTAAQQDTVTLVGRSAENQQINSNSGSTESHQAAGFYFAERQSYRANNGSANTQRSAPALPVEIKDEAVLNGEAPRSSASAGDANGTAAATQNAAQANAASQAAQAASTNTAAAAASATNAAASTAATSSTDTGNSNVVSSTPQQQLAQLDQTLQEIGINPQSIALFNRMAMLLYANDPAALKVLVQTLQTVAPQLSSPSSSATASTGAATSAASAAGSAALTSNSTSAPSAAASVAAAQTQSAASATTNSPPSAGGSGSSSDSALAGQLTVLDVQATLSTQDAAPPGASSTAQPAATSSNSTSTTSTSSSAAASQNSILTIKLEELRVTFAALGSQDGASDGSPASGQTLDITA